MNSQLLHRHSRQVSLCPAVSCSGPPALYPASAARHGARASRHRRRHSVASRRQLLLLGSSGLLVSSLSNQQANAAFVEELVLPFAQEDSEVYAADPPTRVTATGRIVAIGDLHGDWDKAVNALQVAGVAHIDEETLQVQWCGGDTVVVQLGDVLDRGDNEIAIVQLLRALDEQAREQGGAVYMLNGNHESLNVCGDFRYVTPAAFLESAMYYGLDEQADWTDWNRLGKVREKVFKPGGPMARELSKNPTVLIVNNTAFAHGGLLPFHVEYGIERINREVAAWMRADSTPDGGKAQPPFLAMGDANSIMWNRTLSRERFPTPYDRMHACIQLKQALAKVGASRLVVGHTPQLSGANAECDGLVWRIDVGMSQGVLGRPVQVLEIDQDPVTQQEDVRVLTQLNSNSLSIDDYMGSFDL